MKQQPDSPSLSIELDLEGKCISEDKTLTGTQDLVSKDERYEYACASCHLLVRKAKKIDNLDTSLVMRTICLIPGRFGEVRAWVLLLEQLDSTLEEQALRSRENSGV